jgi:Uma2 family endonuclease
MMTAEMTLQTEQASLQALQQSPRLPFYVEELRLLLAREKQQRQAFYAHIQEDDKAEFINGEVIYQSPVKLQHNVASMHVLILLHTFVSKHGLGFVGHEKIMVSLSRNDYEPDVCYFRQEKAQKFTPRQMQFPAPDLVVEVLSDSTTKIDRGVKFTDYAAHGVEEYWLVDPEEESVEQYRLEDATYVLVMKGRTGQIESFVLPGLVIAVQAIFDEEAHRAALSELVS